MPREAYEIIDVKAGKPASLAIFDNPAEAERQISRLTERARNAGRSISELAWRPVEWDWVSE